MKKGTIIKNPWVNDEHPYRKSMYMGVKGKIFESWVMHEGQLIKLEYYKSDLKRFEVCGRSEAWEEFKAKLKIDLGE